MRLSGFLVRVKSRRCGCPGLLLCLITELCLLGRPWLHLPQTVIPLFLSRPLAVGCWGMRQMEASSGHDILSCSAEGPACSAASKPAQKLLSV